MADERQAEDAPGDEWCIVELLGHRRLAGRVSEVQRFGVTMLRIDVPQEDGAFATQFYAGAAIYGVTPTDEATARRVACPPRPTYAYQLPLGSADAVVDSGAATDDDPLF